MPDRPSQNPSSGQNPPSEALHSTGVVHEIRWSEICPWLILIKSLRAAFFLRVLVLAAIGVALTQAGWVVIAGQLAPELEMTLSPRDELPTPILSDDPRELIETVRPARWQSGSPISGWYWLMTPLLKLANQELTTPMRICHVLCGLWAVFVWAFFGGMICRITALSLARDQVLGLVWSARDALSQWMATLGGLAIILAALLALALPLTLLGMLLRIDLLVLVSALVWLVLLAWGLAIAIVAVGLVLGWPLLWTCQAVEQSDAFDGVSRCYAYVYQRPLPLAFFAVVAVVLSLLGDQVVTLFVELSNSACETAIASGMGADRAQLVLAGDLESSPVPLATKLIVWWRWCFRLVAESFPLACLWTMSVGIYLLQRRLIDQTEMDEIALPDKQKSSESSVAQDSGSQASSS